MLRWRPAFQFLHVVVVCLCFAAAAAAQTDRGTLTGTVLDSSGAVVPGATVKAVHVATNFERTVTTSADGAYAIPQLPVGAYVIVDHRERLPDDDAREHRAHRRRHAARRRHARDRRTQGRGHGVGRRAPDPDRQRQGDDGDQQQVHPGSAARRRRPAAIAARPQPHRARGQDRQQRRRRPRQHRDRRRPGRRLGPDGRRRLRDAGCAVRAAPLDDAQLAVGRGHHRVRRRHQRLQGGVRPRRRRRGQLRVALGLQPVPRQGVRVHARRRLRLEQLLQQGART